MTSTPGRSRLGRVRILAATLVAAGVTLALGAASAHGARGLATGLLDDAFGSASSDVRAAAFEDAKAAGARVVRVHAFWRGIATAEPVNPADPADPAYDFGSLDAAVRDASQRGLETLLTATAAPGWAEGPGRSADAPAGTWKPDPVAYGQFARALATRYSGSFTLSSGGTLPRVRYYQAWNEPNLSNHLSPQYEGGAAAAPAIYRSLLNAFYTGVKAVDGSNRVITAGTGPYGDPPGGSRTRPIAFWRDVLCLGGGLEPTACPVKADFDVIAHHPINTSGGPKHSAVHPDDASTPDLHNLVDVLRAAERGGTTGTGGSHEVWATELWWESNPPEGCDGVPLREHARYVAQSLYLLWKQGASLVIWLSLRDQKPRPHECGLERLQSGLTFADARRKPAFEAFRFPFVTDGRGKGKLTAWGKAPAAGKLAIQVKRSKRWETVKRLKVGAGSVFRTRIGAENGKFRAKVGGETSLVWRQR